MTHRPTDKETYNPAKSKGSKLKFTPKNSRSRGANLKPSLEIKTRKIDTYFQRGRGTGDVSAWGLTNNCSNSNLICLKGPKGAAETNKDTGPDDKTPDNISTFVTEPDLNSIPLMRGTYSS